MKAPKYNFIPAGSKYPNQQLRYSSLTVESHVCELVLFTQGGIVFESDQTPF